MTYFFNGGREDVFDREDRVLIPSNRAVATYDLAPEMSAEGITEAALADLAAKRHDLIVLNYANADMVGHTGKWEATISVPFVLVSSEPIGTLSAHGKLGDVAPTLLPLLGLRAAEEMTGTDLLKGNE